MYLRKHAKRISTALLFGLLVWYAWSYLRESGDDLLVSMWNRTFHKFGPDCIYWVTLRLTAWIVVYLHLLRLESGFSVYLFLRQRSYGKVFLRTYAGCMGRAAGYYGMMTLAVVVLHSLALSGAGTGTGSLLGQRGLPGILAEESLEAVSFCLAAYLVHWVFRHAEAGFLAAAAGRLLLNTVTGGGRPALPAQLAVCLVLTGVVFTLAFRNFVEKYVEM